MKLEKDIVETITRVCDQFATAIERYDSISGGEIAPEHVLATYTMMQLGDVLTMTSETSSAKLWTWDKNVSQRRVGQPVLAGAQMPETYRNACGGRRVDLVIFKGDHTRKNEMEMLCLVEIKYGWVDARDISKLELWLDHLPTVPYGVICTALEMPQKDSALQRWTGEARNARRIPVLGRAARPLWRRQLWQTYAKILPRRELSGVPGHITSDSA